MIPKIKVKSIPFDGYQEHYASLLDCELNPAVLFRLLKKIEKNNFKTVGVTLIGKASSQKKYKNLSLEFPVLYLSHSIKSKILPKSILLNFLGGKVENFQYIKEGGRIIGSSFVSDGSKYLKIHPLGGKDLDVAGTFGSQADSVYKKAGKIIKREGMPPGGIYRFWNFMEKISENYASFNKCRDKFFEDFCIRDYPAATGVEAKLSAGQKFSMSFEAVMPQRIGDLTIHSLVSGLQCEASEYGPKFSRAKLLHFKKSGIKKLYISGTSSIDKEGNSARVENAKVNIEYILLCIRHMLKKSQMDFSNIATSIIYVRDEAVYQDFLKLYKKNKWSFPFVVLFANLCRDNLIFEIECVASDKIDESFNKNFLKLTKLNNYS